MKTRWRSGVPNAQLPNKVRILENNDCSFRSRRHLIEGRVRSGIGPCEGPVPGDNSHFTNTRCRCYGGQKKGFQVGKAARSVERLFRIKSVFPEESTRQGPRGFQNVFSKSFQGVSGFHESFGVAFREVGVKLTSRHCTVDRREVKNVSTGKSTSGSASATSQKPGVTELEQRIQAFVRECDALRVAATPVLHKEKTSLVQQKVVLRWTAFHQCPTTCKMWKRWLSCRNCELRNALEVEDGVHQRVLGLIGGARSFKVGRSSQTDAPCQGLASHVWCQVDAKRRCLEGKSALPSMDHFSCRFWKESEVRSKRCS